MAPRPRPPKGASRAAVFAFQTALLTGSGCTSTHVPDDGNGDQRAVDDPQDEPRFDAAVAQAGRGAAQLDAGGFDNSASPALPRQQPEVPQEDDDGGSGLVPIYGGPFPDPRSRAKV